MACSLDFQCSMRWELSWILVGYCQRRPSIASDQSHVNFVVCHTILFLSALQDETQAKQWTWDPGVQPNNDYNGLFSHLQLYTMPRVRFGQIIWPWVMSDIIGCCWVDGSRLTGDFRADSFGTKASCVTSVFCSHLLKHDIALYSHDIKYAQSPWHPCINWNNSIKVKLNKT